MADVEILKEVLGIAETAIEINRRSIGRPSDSDPLGWSMLPLDNATELRGFISGVRFALDMGSPLADELLEKGAERFLRDREDTQAKRHEILEQVQQGKLGGQK